MPALSYKDSEMGRKAGTQLWMPPTPDKQWLLSQIAPETQDTFSKQLAYCVCIRGDGHQPTKSEPPTHHW